MFFAVQALETCDFDDNWAYHSISFLTSKTGITRAIAGPLQAREVGNVPPQRDLSPLRGRTRWGTAAAWHRKRSRDAPLSTVRISEACCACAVSSYLGLPRIWWIKHCQRWLSFPCMRPLFPHNWRTTRISPIKIALVLAARWVPSGDDEHMKHMTFEGCWRRSSCWCASHESDPCLIINMQPL